MDEGEVMTFTLSDGSTTTSLTEVVHIDSEEGRTELARVFGLEE